MNANTPPQSELTALFEHYQNARYKDAFSLAISLTEQYPDHQLSWKALGAVQRMMGNVQGALLANETAARLDPQDPEALYNLSNLLKEVGRIDDAEVGYRHSIALRPDFAEAHLNLGVILHDKGRFSDAESSYRDAIACNPYYAQPHNNLGNVLRDLGCYDKAEVCYRKAIALKPEYAEAHSNLGITMQKVGRLYDAETYYQKAIALRPDFAEAHYNLGTLLQELFRFTEAESSYRSAIVLKSGYVDAYHNLGLILLRRGDAISAFQIAVELIQLNPSVDAKNLFVDSLKNISATLWDPSLSNMVTTALLEPWGRPADIAGFACQLLKQDPEIKKILFNLGGNSTEDADQNNWKSPLLKSDSPSLALFNAILISGPIADVDLEKYLTGFRYELLKISDSIISGHLNSNDSEFFCCALAQQCFINEYIYYQTPYEIDHSRSLRDRLIVALQEGVDIPVSWLITVACYFPLHSLKNSEELLSKPYSAHVMAVLKQQIQEPLEEIRLRQFIPSITEVDDKVSIVVQSQYEQNPYPRWIRLPLICAGNHLNTFISKKYPLSNYSPLADDRNLEVLVAGCGTGQHSIACSQLIKGAKILAVDLSIASLAYAKRKTLEMGIDSIEYAQADILKLTAVGRKFDLIESVGVLHHLDKPFEGWEVLISMLNPNGLMRLGFYSKLARQDIARARDVISQRRIEPSAMGIRNYRHGLHELNDHQELEYARKGVDFYSMSACRDLIFHVQEHRMQLDEIAQFLNTHQLKFLGFDIESAVIESYKIRFPDDPSASNLRYWHIYEQENPHTFTSMYQFLVQKT
jgi:tetratricopeptide (TPR) repeat protein/2-polyprenyl-3-methyl-5-hydroxy-6-metoxy-1,4-benzoquinol methylase